MREKDRDQSTFCEASIFYKAQVGTKKSTEYIRQLGNLPKRGWGMVGARLGHGWGKNPNNLGQGWGKVGARLRHGFIYFAVS